MKPQFRNFKDMKKFRLDVLIPMAEVAGILGNGVNKLYCYYNYTPTSDLLNLSEDSLLSYGYDIKKFDVCLFVYKGRPVFADTLLFSNNKLDVFKLTGREVNYTEDLDSWYYTNTISLNWYYQLESQSFDLKNEKFNTTTQYLPNILEMLDRGELTFDIPEIEEPTFKLNISDFPKSGGFDNGIPNTIELKKFMKDGNGTTLMINYSSIENAHLAFDKLSEILIKKENRITPPTGTIDQSDN